jgi:hypothetical protein
VLKYVSLGVSAAMAATVVVSGFGTTDFHHDPSPHCLPSKLNADSFSDGCASGIFGPRGPVSVHGFGSDVEATGSVPAGTSAKPQDGMSR